MRFWAGLVGIMMFIGNAVAGDIRAIVNDVPISAYDVETQAKMMALQAGRPDVISPELQRRALEELVDEKIKAQEILKRGIQVTAEEIDDALTRLEAQNGMPPGGFQKLMAAAGVPYQALLNQTQTNLGWLRVMHQWGRPVTVSAAETEARLKTIRKDLAREVVSFAEIVVPSLEQATQIREELMQGANFPELAEKYSIADSRLTGGQVMEVSVDIYGNAVADVLRRMQPGQMTMPLKVTDGYAVIVMLNRRAPITGDTVEIWEMMQAVVPENGAAAVLLRHPVENGCEGFAEIVRPDALEGSFQYGQTSPTQLPENIKPVLTAAEFGQVVGPFPMQGGLLFLMKCGASEQRILPAREEIAAQIEAEKMELLSRQILSELKRDAVIEYK